MPNHRSWSLRRKLLKEAPKVLGPSGYTGAKQYDEETAQLFKPSLVSRLTHKFIPRKESELLADVGGVKFKNYMLNNHPDKYSILHRELSKLLGRN